MNKTYLYFISIIIILITHCGIIRDNEIKELQTTTKLNGFDSLKIDPYAIGTISNMFVVDSLLILVNPNDSFHFQAYNLELEKTSFQFGKIGTGPDEISTPSLLQIRKNRGAYDVGINVRRSFSYFHSKKQLPPFENSDFDQTGPFDYNYSRILRLKNGQFVGIGTFEKLYTVSDYEGRVIKTKGKYPYEEDKFSNIDKITLGMAYQGEIALHPKQDKLAYAAYMAPIFEIVDLSKEGKIEKIHSTYFWAPEFTSAEGGNSYSATPSMDNKFGFQSLAVSQNAIYLLYSGRSFSNSNDVYSGNKILCYDWKGNWKRTLEIPMKVKSVAVDNTDDYLYAYVDKQQPVIYVFNL